MNIKKVIAFVSAMALMSGWALTNSSQMIHVSAGQMLGQTNFENGVGLPWHVCESMTGKMDFEVDNGVYKVTVINPGGASHGGEDRWDCQFRYRGLTLKSGCNYTVSYSITASNNCTYYTKIGDMTEPYAEDWHGEPDSSQHESYWDVKQLQANQTQKVTGTFTATRDAEVEWAFHIGGDSVPEGTVFTFDDMSLVCENDNTYDYVDEPEWERAGIVTNQVGYFENGVKRATVILDDNSNKDKTQKFSLIDSSGKEVYSGKTEQFGLDKDSGDTVQIIDFTVFTDAGTYTLKTEDGKSSREFNIGIDDNYSSMLYDGLNYFYQNRSAIDIESDYITSGDKDALAREAGHASDIANIEQTWGYTGSSGTQDVTGGWYDAGDHGKYVVNGGISLWMMNNIYENALRLGKEDSFADNTLSVPEAGNGYPDLLDEARWEMNWMFKMLVADGDYKDMVYHKVHDVKWTALGMKPSDDTMDRIIKPPTTAATLNFVACAAQSARLWKDIDDEFSDKCLDAAKLSYEAAKKHPDMFAPLDESVGGGPYGDNYSDDEFYWAACELYTTTGDNKYLSDIKNNENYLKMQTSIDKGECVDTVGTFDWGNTAALGNMTLYLNKENVSDIDFDTLENNIVEAADKYLDMQSNQGYGLPYGQSTINYSDKDTGYVWGSNSFVLDNSVVTAYAYNVTGDESYLYGVESAMDYILGRNANDYSYVTGYGVHASQYPHHRFWSGQEFDEYPLAPDGVLVGGPNSGMEDPWVRGSGWKKGEIAPQKCYLDNIEAWSVNECTINWNVALCWVDAFLLNENNGISDYDGIIKTVYTDNSDNDSDNSDDSKEQIKDSDESTNKDRYIGNKNYADTDDIKENSSGITIAIYIVIGVLILLIIVSIEIFIYKVLKMKNSENNKNNSDSNNNKVE